MAWKIEFFDTAQKQLRKLDRQWQKAILDYLEERISVLEDPRQLGKVLSGELAEFWRYRVGDYRIICQIDDDKIIVNVVRIGHRKNVYD